MGTQILEASLTCQPVSIVDGSFCSCRNAQAQCNSPLLSTGDDAEDAEAPARSSDGDPSIICNHSNNTAVTSAQEGLRQGNSHRTSAFSWLLQINIGSCFPL